MASIMVWVTCRKCGRDFDCVYGMYAHRARLCALCDKTPIERMADHSRISTVNCGNRQET
jgi:hypothetical protein